jgi:hypothetical protein
MNRSDGTTGNRDRILEALAAELTQAAYAVALRHKATGSWIDLELNLWRALEETVQEWVSREAGEVNHPEVRRDARRGADRHYVRQTL